MSRRWPWRAVVCLLAAALLTLLAGCGGERADPEGPPELRPRLDVCPECGMAIVEVRFAAGYMDPDTGEPVLFDDIGDMVRYLRRYGIEPVAWVHDRETREWIRADEAWFVYGGGLGGIHFDLVAFAGEEEARSRAGPGEVLRWDQVKELDLEPTLQPYPDP